MKSLKKIVDPFNYYSGERTFAVGVVGLFAAALVNHLGGETTRGIVSSGYGDLSFIQALCQILAAWIILSTLLYLAARLLSKSKIRMIDLYGNQLLARIALFPVLLLGALSPLRSAALQLTKTSPEELAAHFPIGLIAFGFTALICLVWFFLWSYRGYAVAANLKGWKAVVSYMVCYLLAEIIGGLCTAWIAQW
ncbi:hypothetical protein [uncultured Alistipes sp.]|uniref:hypothetical protein n=1 Tax=uncultured Alistipes sp. TaxID=538949 RepID=UPI001F99DBA1|nr:hypothetical protein [uncultured Alistipes sp.]HJC26888.1 hypothetical protein [Candidatus Alistipes stercoravium]